MLRIALLLTLLTTNLIAQESIRMFDGANVSCESKYDVFNSKRQLIYSLKSTKIKELEKTVKLKLKVLFLSCVEKNGEFVLVPRKDSINASYTTIDGRLVSVKEKKREIIAHDQLYKLVGQSEIKEAGSSASVELEINRSDLDANNFPQAQDKGAFFTTIRLRTITSYQVGSEDLRSHQRGYGAFRLFFDL